MNVHRSAILGVLLLAAACSQTAVNSATVARVAGPHPAMVRTAAGSVWVGASIVSEPHTAWALPAQGEVADLDVMPIGSSSGFVVTFRQGGSRWQGYLDPELRAASALEQVDESPASATLMASSAAHE